MKRALPLVLAFVAASTFAVAAAAAQEWPPADRYWMVHQETVRPSGLASYEAASREFVATVKANAAVMPNFRFLAFVDETLTYTYTSPIAGFAGVDAVGGDFGALAEAIGPEKFGALMSKGFAEVDHVTEQVVVVPAGLSYRPATPRLKPEEETFLHFDFYAVLPGHEMEAEQIAREFVALYKAKNISTGYTFYKVALGSDMPLYIVSVGARDQADYQAAFAADLKLLGPEAQALFARAFTISRKVWTRNVQVRPDLAVPPAAN